MILWGQLRNNVPFWSQPQNDIPNEEGDKKVSSFHERIPVVLCAILSMLAGYVVVFIVTQALLKFENVSFKDAVKPLNIVVLRHETNLPQPSKADQNVSGISAPLLSNTIEVPANLTNALQPVGRPIAKDMAVHVICHRTNWHRLGNFLESVRSQTYATPEVIVVLSLDEEVDKLDGGELMDLKLLTALDSLEDTTLKLYIRGGKISQGNNRKFASKHSTTDVLTFFDCDDYMHHQRVEVLYNLFLNHPDLQIALHLFESVNPKNFDKPEGQTSKTEFGSRQFPAEVVRNQKPAWDYSEVRRQLPQNATGVTYTEPNTGGWIWWFPVEMDLTWPNSTNKVGYDISNGWVTARREVFQKVEYPDSFLGEDSLFVWRAIRDGFNFTAVRLVLGAYVRAW